MSTVKRSYAVAVIGVDQVAVVRRELSLREAVQYMRSHNRMDPENPAAIVTTDASSATLTRIARRQRIREAVEKLQQPEAFQQKGA